METYKQIIAILSAFIFGYMLSVQMQNDMYKELIKEINQCQSILK